MQKVLVAVPAPTDESRELSTVESNDQSSSSEREDQSDYEMHASPLNGGVGVRLSRKKSTPTSKLSSTNNHLSLKSSCSSPKCGYVLSAWNNLLIPSKLDSLEIMSTRTCHNDIEKSYRNETMNLYWVSMSTVTYETPQRENNSRWTK